MKLTTLADVRALVQHLPKDHREKSTWQHVEVRVGSRFPQHKRLRHRTENPGDSATKVVKIAQTAFSD